MNGWMGREQASWVDEEDNMMREGKVKVRYN